MESYQIVSELLICLFNSIVFQRGIYEPKLFQRTQKWGIPLMLCNEQHIKNYFTEVVREIRREWLRNNERQLSDVCMLFIGSVSGNALEKWQFSFHESVCHNAEELTEDEIKSNIRNIMRQIHSSIAFLPLIEIGEDVTLKITVTDAVPKIYSGVLPKGWRTTSSQCVDGGINGEFDDVRINEQLIIQPRVYYKTY